MKDLESVRAHVEILRACKRKAKEVERLKSKAEESIKDVLGNNEQGALDGEIVVTWASHKQNKLNQKALKEAHPETVASFTELTSVRTFKLVE